MQKPNEAAPVLAISNWWPSPWSRPSAGRSTDTARVLPYQHILITVAWHDTGSSLLRRRAKKAAAASWSPAVRFVASSRARTSWNCAGSPELPAKLSYRHGKAFLPHVGKLLGMWTQAFAYVPSGGHPLRSMSRAIDHPPSEATVAIG